METQILKAQPFAATEWLRGGWTLFQKVWKTWLLAFLIVLVLCFIFRFIPYLGHILNVVLIDIVSIAALLALKEVELKGSINWRSVADQTQAKLTPIITLILINLALTLALAILNVGAIMGGSSMASQGIGFTLGAGFSIMLLVNLAYAACYIMVNYFAKPLIAFTDISAIDAVKLSFKGCLINTASVTVCSILFAVLFIIGALLFGVGLLVVYPVTFAAWYISAKEIFPEIKAATEL